MEVCARRHQEEGWTIWPDAITGLGSLVDPDRAQCREVVIVGRASSGEDEEMLAALRVARSILPECGILSAAIAYPSRKGIEHLRSAGADRVYLIGEPRRVARPSLHVSRFPSATAWRLSTRSAPRSTSQRPTPPARSLSVAVIMTAWCSHKNMKRWCVGEFHKCHHRRLCDRH